MCITSRIDDDAVYIMCACVRGMRSRTEGLYFDS